MTREGGSPQLLSFSPLFSSTKREGVEEKHVRNQSIKNLLNLRAMLRLWRASGSIPAVSVSGIQPKYDTPPATVAGYDLYHRRAAGALRMETDRRALILPTARSKVLHDTPEPEDVSPEPLQEITDDISKHSMAKRRIDGAAEVEEPEMQILEHVDPDEALRDQTKFSIISRHLFRNEKNEQILDSLVEAGYPMHLRTLQRILARSDFQEYYAKYRQAVLGPLDAEIRECMKQAMPEAFNQLVKVMRKGRD